MAFRLFGYFERKQQVQLNSNFNQLQELRLARSYVMLNHEQAPLGMSQVTEKPKPSRDHASMSSVRNLSAMPQLLKGAKLVDISDNLLESSIWPVGIAS